MSLSETLFKHFEDAIETYANNIAEKYSLDKDELLDLWNNGAKKKPVARAPVQHTTKSDLTSVDMNDLSLERLNNCNKAELSALCKAKGCKCTGTKAVLIDRLLGREENSEPKSTAKKPVENKKSVKKTERTTATLDVVKKLTADIPVIPLRRNAHGNLVHPETSLVFDKKLNIVVGKQEDDGTISELTDDDIEACKRFKFKYSLPDNLEKKGDLDQVKIEELDESSDVEVVDDEEEDDIDVEDDEEEVELEDEEDE